MPFNSSAPELPSLPLQTLIVGLGNPGAKYEKTRHNIGFEAVKAFAAKSSLTFKKESTLNAEVAKGSVNGHPFILLLPQTYMNRSGEAVIRTIHYFKLFEGCKESAEPKSESRTFSRILVVFDDVYTPYGSFKLKEKGSSGGHNGLKNIELHLKTQNYPRLKMGVGPLNQDYSLRLELGQALEDYVLSKFTSSENLHFNQFIDNSVKIIENWLVGDFKQTVTLAGQLKTEEDVKRTCNDSSKRDNLS